MGGLAVVLLFVVQVALLVVHYGFGIMLPWWLLWLPVLVIIGIVVIWVLFVIAILLLAILLG